MEILSPGEQPSVNKDWP